jgi:hypothetical protein
MILSEKIMRSIRRQAHQIRTKATSNYKKAFKSLLEANEKIISGSTLGSYSTDGIVPQGIAVTVKDVGLIGFPLSLEQAKTLISKSQSAPFGKGKQTIVDTDVRRAWQIDGSLVTLNDKWTAEILPALVSDVCIKLGVKHENVDAKLYKLLCYEKGGHFKKHRDTEKEPGMFGTLIVQLPSEHRGGDLVIEHIGRRVYKMDEASADVMRYVAFYADCEHSLEEVTDGIRLTLAYNLVSRATEAYDIENENAVSKKKAAAAVKERPNGELDSKDVRRVSVDVGYCVSRVYFTFADATVAVCSKDSDVQKIPSLKIPATTAEEPEFQKFDLLQEPFLLRPEEHIVRVNVKQSEISLYAIQFVTNLGRSSRFFGDGDFEEEGEVVESFEAAAGQIIVGLKRSVTNNQGRLIGVISCPPPPSSPLPPVNEKSTYSFAVRDSDAFIDLFLIPPFLNSCVASFH